MGCHGWWDLADVLGWAELRFRSVQSSERARAPARQRGQRRMSARCMPCPGQRHCWLDERPRTPVEPEPTAQASWSKLGQAAGRGLEDRLDRLELGSANPRGRGVQRLCGSAVQRLARFSGGVDGCEQPPTGRTQGGEGSGRESQPRSSGVIAVDGISGTATLRVGQRLHPELTWSCCIVLLACSVARAGRTLAMSSHLARPVPPRRPPFSRSTATDARLHLEPPTACRLHACFLARLSLSGMCIRP